MDEDVEGAADEDPGPALVADGELDGEDFADGDIDMEGAALEGFTDGVSDMDGAAVDAGEAFDDGDFDAEGADDEDPGRGLAATGALDGDPFEGTLGSFVVF